MPTTPLDLAYQQRLRELVSTVLPEAGAQHIAEAIAAGYGFRSHAALLADIRVVEAGGDVPVPEFDYEAFLTRLGEQGESLDHRRAETLRPALIVAAEGPLSGIAADARR